MYEYEVRDDAGMTIAIFEDFNRAMVFAASNGYKVVQVELGEEVQLPLPNILKEA